MKRTILSIATVCLLLAAATPSFGQNTNQTKTMEKVKQGKDVVQNFFKAFGNGDFDGVINSFHDQCTIIGTRDSERSGTQIYGTYKGKEGAKAFISNLGNTFNTKAFSVEHIVGQDNVVFANGKFTHIIKSTGKTFSSDWALKCIIKDDKIVEYHFYEDSEKFSEASK